MTVNPLLDELNRDIWHPFRGTYHARDLEGFLALYDPDLIRAGGPTKEVYGFDRLAADTTGWFAHVAERGDSLDIEFRFTERIAADELASEQGCYQITATLADGSNRVMYGRFHTFARKIRRSLAHRGRLRHGRRRRNHTRDVRRWRRRRRHRGALTMPWQ